MATNKEKYQTICNRVGLGRDSWALERFIADCVNHHMDDQPGKLVALRLTEHYELLDRLNILPGGLAMISPVMVTETPGNGPVSVPSSGGRASERQEHETSSGSRAMHGEETDGSSRTPDTNRADAEDNQWDDL